MTELFSRVLDGRCTGAEQLARYVRSLGDAFTIHTEIDGSYNHIGATIADAILQANRDYEVIVRPRVRHILAVRHEYSTTAALNHLLKTVTVNTFLCYEGAQRKQRFVDVLQLFTREEIQTTDDLKRWLSNDPNLVKLRAIKGIGPKTVDYFKILVGLQTAAFDRRLETFLAWAKIEHVGYTEACAIINQAADLLGHERAHFDHSIWRYVGEMLSSRPACFVIASIECANTA